MNSSPLNVMTTNDQNVVVKSATNVVHMATPVSAHADKKGIFVILMFFIFWLGLIMGGKNICDGNANSLNSNVKLQANIAQMAVSFSFVTMQVSRIWKYGVNNDFSNQFICSLASAVSTLVGTSCLLDYLGDWGGVCVDTFGVTLPFTTWAEWIVCVPLLSLLAVYTDEFDSITNMDIVTITLLAASMVSGFAMSFGVSIPVYFALFVISTAFCIYAIYLSLAISRSQGTPKKSQVLDVLQSCEAAELSCKQSTRTRKLSLLFSIILAPFPVTYALGAAGILSADTTYTLLMFFNIFLKVLFLNEACDAQVDLTKTLATTIASIREQANISRRFFLRYLFHEVRVPLNSVLLGLTLLSSKDTVDATEKEAIEMMVESANFMADTLNDVLEMNEIEEGHMKLVNGPFSMFSLLARSKKSLTGVAATKRVDMLLNVADDTPDLIQGDRLRLEHVMVSLLAQAIKNSPSGAVVTISVVCKFAESEELTSSARLSIAEEQKKTYCITIADFGARISATDLKNLFVPFQALRPEQMQQAQGTGLGLSLARDIIELHGGTLTYKPSASSSLSSICSADEFNSDGINLDNTGNIFSIELPYEPVSENFLSLLPQPGQSFRSGMLPRISEGSSSQNGRNKLVSSASGSNPKCGSGKGSNQSGSGSSPNGKIMQCLIVDDTASNRKMLAMVLSKRNIESAMAEDGFQAVQMVQDCSQGFYDIIFMDNTMPIMTGVEATAALRSPRIAYPNLIIGVTGNALDDDVTAFLDAGADMVLAKPMRPTHLQQLLAYITSHGKQSNPDLKLSMGATGVIRIPVERFGQQLPQQPQHIRPAENI